MDMTDAIIEHNKRCDCQLIVGKNEHGPTLECRKNGSLVWWPMVKTIGLSEAQDAALFIVAPLLYDDDSWGVNDVLLSLGFSVIDQGNFNEAKNALKRHYEEENIAKQLLIDAFD